MKALKKSATVLYITISTCAQQKAYDVNMKVISDTYTCIAKRFSSANLHYMKCIHNVCHNPLDENKSTFT